jgi:hypothetical protein
MNFRSFKWDLDFIHDMLQEGAPVAVLGGIVAIAAGFALEKPSMILVGAFVLLIISADYIILHLFGSRSSK